jgi:site-specific DNA-methyltransferase (adenine-specific)
MITSPAVEPYTVGEAVRIYNMDCVEGAKQYIFDSSVDLLIADPPFAIGEENFTSFYNRSKEHVIPGYVPAPEDYFHFSVGWMIQAYRVLKEHGSMYVVSGWTNGHLVQTALLKIGFVLINEIIWQYNFPVFTQNKYNSAHYRIYYCKKSKKSKPTFNKNCRFTADEKDQHGRSIQYHDMSSVWYTKKEFHRGRKKNINKLPDELVRKMVAYSSYEHDLIADFFLGSGTTAIQAQNMARRVIGFEKNPDAFRHLIAELEGPRSDVVPKDGTAMVTSA